MYIYNIICTGNNRKHIHVDETDYQQHVNAVVVVAAAVAVAVAVACAVIAVSSCGCSFGFSENSRLNSLLN